MLNLKSTRVTQTIHRNFVGEFKGVGYPVVEYDGQGFKSLNYVVPDNAVTMATGDPSEVFAGISYDTVNIKETGNISTTIQATVDANLEVLLPTLGVYEEDPAMVFGNKPGEVGVAADSLTVNASGTMAEFSSFAEGDVITVHYRYVPTYNEALALFGANAGYTQVPTGNLPQIALIQHAPTVFTSAYDTTCEWKTTLPLFINAEGLFTTETSGTDISASVKIIGTPTGDNPYLGLTLI
jgi:hypothetical protein